MTDTDGAVAKMLQRYVERPNKPSSQLAPPDTPSDGITVPRILVGAAVIWAARRYAPEPAAAALGAAGVVLHAIVVERIEEPTAKAMLHSLATVLSWASLCIIWPAAWGPRGWVALGALTMWMTLFVGWAHFIDRCARSSRRWRAAWAKAAQHRRDATRTKRRALGPIKARVAHHERSLAAEAAGGGATLSPRAQRIMDRYTGLTWEDYCAKVAWPPGTVHVEDKMTSWGLRRSVRLADGPVAIDPVKIARAHARLRNLPADGVAVTEDRGNAAIWHLQERTTQPFARVPPIPLIVPGRIVHGYGPLLRHVTTPTRQEGSESLLIAGTTGSGKTQQLRWEAHQWLGQDALVCGFDPKAGAALGDMADAFAEYAPTPTESERLMRDVVRRMHARYARTRTGRMYDGQDLVVLIDELPRLTPDTLGLLPEITAMGRQARVHVVAATQSPRVQNVGGGEVLANFPARIVFRTANQTENQMAMGTYAADLRSHELPAVSGPGPRQAYVIGMPGIAPQRMQSWLVPEDAIRSYPPVSARASEDGPYAGHSDPDTAGDRPVTGVSPPPVTGPVTAPDGHPANVPAPQGGDVLPDSQRLALAALRTGARTVASVAESTGLDPRRASDALAALARKRYAVKDGRGIYRPTTD